MPTALERLGMADKLALCLFRLGITVLLGIPELFLWIEAGKILVISDSFCDWNREQQRLWRCRLRQMKH